MGVYEQQVQATSKTFDPELRTVEQHGGEILSPGTTAGDADAYDWADVIRELEPWY
jgi:hypothetical protein